MAKQALLIDDDAANVALCQLILTERGYHVTSAPDLSSARAYFDQDIALFVVDYHLPDSNGVDAVHAIREHYPDQVICVLSMDDDNDVIKDSIRAGGNIYMVKPATPTVIAEMLKDIETGRLSATSQQLVTQHGKRSYV